ncbi:XRE family transcriptional regulator [Noviherbaspirillum malthae]|uniref:XRE family transcriptional regulator n=1 Tax=Noviherbaspirillum malthae TaxID=1260987 RepID=UPI00188E283C|nr:XRE family transcriptional regulator [Noviherbaspirillum malthae]
MPAKPLNEEQKKDAERLSLLFEERKAKNSALTQESLAHDCGWKTQGTVSQYLRGKIPLNLSALLKFAKALNFRPEEVSPSLASQMKIVDAAILGDDGSVTFIEAKTTMPSHDMPPGSFPIPNGKFRRIPVFGKAMGGFPERAWDDDGGYPPGFSAEYAEVASSDPNAFLVPVEGDSMIPRFYPGEYALVEPNTEPEIEDFVLVRLGTGETLIKQLLGRRGAVRLGSLNNNQIISAPPEKIVWMYYVAHPVPARKIKTRT